MNPFLYKPIFFAVIGIIALITSMRCIASPDYIRQRHDKMLIPLLLSLVLVFWLGYRPISGRAFGDTANYAIEYFRLDPMSVVSMDWHVEWIWTLLMVTCKSAGLTVSDFMTVVAAGYILSALWAVKRFFPKNPMLGLLFVWGSLMFFSFGVNGLRNGLACHVTLLAMSYFFDDKYMVGALLCLLAFGIHRSVILPIAGMLAGRYLIKDLKYAIYIWGASILISLTVGSIITDFFAALDFDDRMSTYTSIYQSEAANTGFRYDFLLYSSFPVFMGWFVCEKLKIKDDWYKTLCITYCLANSFWIFVIRSAFSNRFAYLSWFIYPIVIAYPLINLPVWRDQHRKVAMILLLYCAFTLFMQLIYW